MFTIERRYQILILLLLGALLFGGGVKYAQHFLSPGRNAVVIEGAARSSDGSGLGEGTAPFDQSQEELTFIYVHVKGAVQKPGVYQLPPNARLFEAVDKALPLPEADLQVLNLAQILKDGEPIYVPKVGELSVGGGANEIAAIGGPVTMSGSSGFGAAAGSTGKVNINTASAQELADRLPGIGPTLAQRIVEYRQQNGDFRSIEDIQNVSGIGERRYAQMKEFLAIY